MTNSSDEQSIQTPTSGRLGFPSLCGIVFIASAATMMIEIAAGRVIAMHLGASIYTWTSVIGVVLAGLAAGNYIGGRMADRRSGAGTLAGVLLTASFACSLSSFADQIAAGWPAMWRMSWPVRTAVHVAIAYLPAALALGVIAPIVVKMAMDAGVSRGRAVGTLSAAGAVGSIVGTFAAGFYLIAWIGTLGLASGVAALLAVIAVGLQRSNARVLTAAALAFTPVLIIWRLTGFAASDAPRLRLSGAPPRSDLVVFSTESQYSYVEVYAFAPGSSMRGMKLDSLVHSEVDLNDAANLQYEYERIFAAITNKMHPGTQALQTLTIGGGGYVFPRYLAESRPGSETDVVEIDPVVTQAAFETFGVSKALGIRCFHEDGRMFVERMLTDVADGLPRAVGPQQAAASTGSKPDSTLYDIIYVDALNGYQVPYQLTTVEFVARCRKLLKFEGAYLLEMIDVYESGLFLGSVIQTLEQAFPHVYVFAEPLDDGDWRRRRKPFVVAAFNRPFEGEGLGSHYAEGYDVVVLTPAELDELKGRSGTVLLTDAYAPVENLLAPVVVQAASDRALMDWVARIRHARETRGEAVVLEMCDRALGLDWNDWQRRDLLAEKTTSLLNLQRYAEAEAICREQLHRRVDDPVFLDKLFALLFASRRYEECVDVIRLILALELNAENQYYLVASLIALERFAEAEPEAAKLIELDPSVAAGYLMRSQCLARTSRLEEARALLRGYLKANPNDAAVAAELERLGGMANSE